MNPENIKRILKIAFKDEFPVESMRDLSMEQLSSKQNIVYNVKFNKPVENFPKEIIVKFFQTGKAENEYRMLLKLQKQKLSIPKVKFFKNPYLILEKIEGINLCDFINDPLKNVDSLESLKESVFDEIILGINSLASWMAEFHRKNIVTHKRFTEAIVLNKGDTRLRDFIINISEEKIYGLDFENAYEGNHLDDLAWICCALLDTNPGIFEYPDGPHHKTELINQFLKRYYKFNEGFHFSFDYFADKLIEDLNIVIERRELDMSLSKDKIMGSISKGV